MITIKNTAGKARTSFGLILMALVSISVLCSQCSKNSDNGETPPSGDASFTVQNNFTDPLLSDQHHSAAIQPDGKIIVSQIDGKMLRLTTDGKIDGSFTAPAFNQDAIISDIAIQPDGKILASGRLFITDHPNIVRLNSDGSIDNSFKAMQTDGIPESLVLRNDGKIIVAGDFSYASGNGLKYHVMRLNANGTIDNGFSCALGYSADGANCAGLAADGKILLGGKLTSGGSGPHSVVRLNEDGSIDGSFSFPQVIANGGQEGRVLTLAIDKNGKILIGGSFYAIGQSTTNYNCLARLNSDGSLDNGFHPPAIGTYYVTAIKPLDNGDILIGRRLKSLSVDIPDFFTVLNDKGEASDFRLGFGRGGIDEIVQENATSFILVGVFKTSTTQFGLTRLVRK